MTHRAVGRRAVDIIVSLMLIVLTLPVLVVSAVGTAIALRAWPFFSHRRVGLNGDEFTFIKLRTLPPHAPRYADKYQLHELKLPAFSRALRQLHLDELPQLWLVVIGKMSLVGPRPEMPYLHEQYDPGFARRRSTVRPGCTGAWQVSEHCDQMIFEHPEFDEFYLRNRSLRFDLWIVVRTIRLLLPVRDRRLTSLEALPNWAVRDATALRDFAQLPTASLQSAEAA